MQENAKKKGQSDGSVRINNNKWMEFAKRVKKNFYF